MMQRFAISTSLCLTMLLAAACSSDQPRQNDIIEALENAHFMNERITADRISSYHCTPANGMHECVIMYRTKKKRAEGEIGIDRVSKLRLQIELVGKRWRVSRLVLT